MTTQTTVGGVRGLGVRVKLVRSINHLFNRSLIRSIVSWLVGWVSLVS